MKVVIDTNILVSAAIASDADFFITGDRDFTEVQGLGNTLIISVSLFAELMMKYAGNGNTNQMRMLKDKRLSEGQVKQEDRGNRTQTVILSIDAEG